MLLNNIFHMTMKQRPKTGNLQFPKYSLNSFNKCLPGTNTTWLEGVAVHHLTSLLKVSSQWPLQTVEVGSIQSERVVLAFLKCGVCMPMGSWTYCLWLASEVCGVLVFTDANATDMLRPATGPGGLIDASAPHRASQKGLRCVASSRKSKRKWGG